MAPSWLLVCMVLAEASANPFGMREGATQALADAASSSDEHALNANLRATNAQRSSCAHWQHMGCLMDTLEKTCEEDGGGVAQKVDVATARARESVWACCCPRPYAPCARAEADPTCLAAMRRRFKPLAAAVRAAPRGVPTLPAAVLFAFQVAIVAVRSDLWEAGGEACQSHLAKPAPLLSARAVCGAKPAEPRSLKHNGYFCECVTWQWENLGDGNADEFKQNRCPIPVLALGQAPENEPLHRHGAGRKGVYGAFDVPEVFPAPPTSGPWAVCGDVKAGLLWASEQIARIQKTSTPEVRAGWDAPTLAMMNAAVKSFKKIQEEWQHGDACSADGWEMQMLFLKEDDPVLAAGPHGLSTAGFTADFKAIAVALEALGVFIPVRWRWHTGAPVK